MHRAIVLVLMIVLLSSVAYAQGAQTAPSQQRAIIMAPDAEEEAMNKADIVAEVATAEYDAAGRIVARTDSSVPEVEDEVLVAQEQGDPESWHKTFIIDGKAEDEAGYNEIAMDDVPGAEKEEHPDFAWDPKANEAGFGDGIRGTRPPADADALPSKYMNDDIPAGSKSSPLIQHALAQNQVIDEHEKWIDVLSAEVDTEEELEEYGEAIEVTQTYVEEVEVDIQHIRVIHVQPAKLFGIFDITYETETTVDETGRVKVKFPWFLAFAQDNSEAIQADMEHELAHIVQQEPSAQKQQQTLQTISNVAKMHHDTGMAIIRKIGS